MTDDFTRINEPRVEKILHMLDTILKSARSNNADPSLILAPARSRLLQETRTPLSTVLPGTEPSVATQQPQTRSQSHWSDAIEMARTAPLSDAVAAMQVILTRIDEELL